MDILGFSQLTNMKFKTCHKKKIRVYVHSDEVQVMNFDQFEIIEVKGHQIYENNIVL